jgi:FkbM family methyltransferase
LSTESHRLSGYAHWGEDLVVSFLLDGKRDGFYVDVGCYHPTLYSNTARLFDAGWHGVNIDPNPFMIEQFKVARPNDVNLNLAISDVGGVEIDYFIFNDWASSNTASSGFAKTVTTGQNVSVQRTIRVPAETLLSVFELHCAGQTIDFLNIDVEDLDLQVLQSNDWKKWRPSVVAIEDFQFDFTDPARSAIFNLMLSHSYEMVSRQVYTSIFVSKESNIRLYRRD